MTNRMVAGEGLRFAVVGAVATLVSATAFNLLVHWPPGGPSPLAHKPLTAFALANLLGMVVSYTGTRSWAFRDRAAVGFGGGLPAFVAINVASWAVPLTCLAFTRYALGLDDPTADNVAANGVGLGLGMLLRFWMLRRTVFLAPSHSRASQPADAVDVHLAPRPAVPLHAPISLTPPMPCAVTTTGWGPAAT